MREPEHQCQLKGVQCIIKLQNFDKEMRMIETKLLSEKDSRKDKDKKASKVVQL